MIVNPSTTSTNGSMSASECTMSRHHCIAIPTLDHHLNTNMFMHRQHWVLITSLEPITTTITTTITTITTIMLFTTIIRLQARELGMHRLCLPHQDTALRSAPVSTLRETSS